MVTPMLGYDVEGVRDSIKNHEIGVLVKGNTPENLVASAITVLTDDVLLKRLSSNALSFSKKFSWGNSADAFDRIIVEEWNQTSKT